MIHLGLLIHTGQYALRCLQLNLPQKLPREKFQTEMLAIEPGKSFCHCAIEL